MSTPAPEYPRRLKIYFRSAQDRTALLAFEGLPDLPIQGFIPQPTANLVDEMNWYELTCFANGYFKNDISKALRRDLLILLADVQRPTLRIQMMELHDRDEGGGLIKTRMPYLCVGLMPIGSYKKFPRGLLLLDKDRAEVERLVPLELKSPERVASFWRAVNINPWAP